MIRDFLRSLLPEFWLMNYPYSKSWDKALNRLLDSHQFEKIGRYEAALGGHTVWIENYPYAAFRPLIRGKNQKVRPSRMTILRARRALEKQPGFAKNYDDFGDVR